MAKKPVLTPVTNLASGSTITAFNNNLVKITDAFDNTLSRDGSSPNQMDADIDLNSNDLLNVNRLDANSLTFKGVDFDAVLEDLEQTLENAIDQFDDAEAVIQNLTDQAEAARDASEVWTDKAEEWAEKAVDIPVEAGQFSAKHYATKSIEGATNALISQSAAAVSATLAATSRADALAAAQASGQIPPYDTYAAANAALGTIPANQAIDVLRDETRGGVRAIYRKEGGVLVWKLDVQPEGASLPAGFFANGSLANALNAWRISTKKQISLPAGDVSQLSYQVQDGEHLVIDMNSLSRILMTTAGSTTLSFYSVPLWTEAVSSVGSVSNQNLAEAGNTATTNAVSTLTIANAQSVKKGQLLKIVSDDDIPGAKHGDVNSRCRLGEFVVVGVDSTGTTITLATRLLETYTTNVRVFAMPDARVDFIGGQGDFAESQIAASNALPFIRLEGLRGCLIERFRTKRALAIGISLVGCYNTKIVMSDFVNHRNDVAAGNFGYGIDDIGSEGTVVVGISGNNLRHVYTTDSYQVEVNQVGRNLHRYGRSRNASVSGSVGTACSNAAFDTHDEADGIVLSGLSVRGSYSGSGSTGSAYELRGRNISLIGSNSDGGQVGLYVRTQTNGKIVGSSATRCSKRAIHVGPGSYDGTQNIEATFIGGIYESQNGVAGEVVHIEADVGQRTSVKLIGEVLIKASGDITSLNQIINLDSRVDLEIDAIVDITNATSSDSLAGIIRLADNTSTVKGKLKVINNGSTNVTRLITGSPGVAEVQLEVEWVGTAYPTSSTDNDPFASEGQAGTRLSGRIITPSGERNTRSSSSTPANAATVVLKRRGEERFQQALSSSTGTRVGANALSLDISNLRPGQIVDIKNESINVIQFTTPVGFTLGPGAVATLVALQTLPVTVQLTDVSFPYTGIASKTASFTVAEQDRFALIGLNDTLGTQIVTLPDTGTVPANMKVRFIQQNTGVWTFQAATGTLRSLSNFTKTAGRWATVEAEAVGSDWRLSGNLVA